MPPDVIIVALIAVPVILLFILQINAALAFLSLCLGSVLVQFTGSDAASILGGAGKSAETAATFVQLGLLLGPLLLTMVCMIKTVKKSWKFFNILPAVASGFLAALLAVPLLPSDLASKVVASNLWGQIQSLEAAIVASGAAICLLFLLLQRPKHSEEDGGKKHKK